MRGYGQFCPIAKASEIVSERWTILILRELGAGSDNFNDIRRGLPLISPTLLSNRLKTLEKHDIVRREQNNKAVRYKLTAAGEELTQIIWQLGTWGHRWVRTDLGEEDLDPSMLVWDIHRTIDTTFFTEALTVIRIEFTDYTSQFHFWWIVIRDADADVCLKDPGYEVDLNISTDLRSLTAAWMGHSTLNKEIKAERIRLTGSSQLKRHINKWLGTNYYAGVKDMRKQR